MGSFQGWAHFLSLYSAFVSDEIVSPLTLIHSLLGLNKNLDR